MTTEAAGKPRVGIPFRTLREERAGDRSRYDTYVDAVRRAGGEPVEVSLGLAKADPAALAALSRTLDAIVLPGSPSDVDPTKYGSPRHARCAEADADREGTDFALLKNALEGQKPVLAICYGIQSLNVFLGGSLVQDIGSELHTEIQHQWVGRKSGTPEPFHAARVELDSRLFELAKATEVRVNSSHHQSVLKPGRNLRVTAVAPDGVIEAVEWTGDRNWVTGVQWHPERMVATDALALALFRGLVAAAAKGTMAESISGRK